MKISEEHYLKIQSLAESGQYTYQEICNACDNQYTLNQIRYYINKHCPNKNIKKEYSRGGAKLESLLKQIFPYDKIIKEYSLPDRLRVDFVVQDPYNLAFEFDGSQHNEFSSHFHGDKTSFLRSKDRDTSKEYYLKERGINLIRLNNTEVTLNDLNELISVCGYGSGVYTDQATLTYKERIEQKQKAQKLIRQKAREENKPKQQKLQQKKISYKKPKLSDEMKEKQRQYRKDQYEKAKAWKKNLKK